MAVKLRLTRMGKKKQPFYRIVATDSRTRRDGKYIEKIGYYNPVPNPSEIVIDEEKAFYWLKNGAIPSDTVKNLFSQKGIMLKWHHIKQGSDEAKVDEEYKKWEVLQLEKQKREEALAAQSKRDQDAAPQEVTEPEAKQETEPEKKAEAIEPEAKQETEPEKKAEAIEPEAKQETEPEKKAEAIEPEAKQEQVPETKEEVPAENKEQAVEPQAAEDQGPEQDKEVSESQAAQPPAEAAENEKPGEDK